MRSITIIAAVVLLAIALAAQPCVCDEVMVNSGDSGANRVELLAAKIASAAADATAQQHKGAAFKALWQEKKAAVAAAANTNTNTASPNPLLQDCVDLYYDCTEEVCCAPGICCPNGPTYTCLYPTC